jgi:porphobilinogen synthase
MSEFLMPQRPRRNRKSAPIRSAISETQVSVNNLLFPLFVLDGQNRKEEISSMPGIYRFSEGLILAEIEACLKQGIQLFALFPVVDDSLKDKTATYSYSRDNFYCRTIRNVKAHFPEATILTDVAMDPMATTGLRGMVKFSTTKPSPFWEIWHWLRRKLVPI